MKSRFNSSFFLIIALALLGCTGDETAIPELICNQPDLIVNRSVAEVHNNTNPVAAKYLYDDIIEGYVVSSDESGNFFKTISIQTLPDKNGVVQGFNIGIDATNTYIDYRIGRKVFVKLKDQFTDINFGSLRIGSLFVNAYGNTSVGRIDQNDYKNVLNASCIVIDENRLVRSLTVSELLNDNNINTLVELSNVQFSDAAMGRYYFEEANSVGGATNWNLRDKAGNQVIFRTSRYANFAGKLVPKGSGAVRGILTKYGSDYQIMVRSDKDIVMEGKRSVPFFSEDFQMVQNNVNFSLPGWSNIVVKGTKLWKSIVYAGNGYAEFNTTSTTAAEIVAWLVSPKINIDDYKNSVLSFRSAQHDLKVDSPSNSLEVYVSTNFDGSNVGKAKWIKLEAILPTLSTPARQFISSDRIDLSAYSGDIHIAFKYVGSGKDKTLNGAFMVDDVVIVGDK
ncbi:DUF5689 domain-containing protein [Flavobacterium sp. LS1R47]|uniref:DUF5689 domain-containing protein n=1 Tax=Flavobacterium frigoritolerans TaxID=2987686 RepID=A0A9X2ZMA6_9FLAO|nr:DUF5689 domain-containing protein [Flavobacterium frigoritolerans]MCV9932437.1 DUF5689 domain-containing protein [Flavobacterium frigoritolerans]